MPARLPDVLQQIQTEARALFGRGQVASYIPALAQVAPRQFGMAVALTDGTAHAAGDFAYRIGLPVKTGVGGGIVAIVPGRGTVSVWAPELDAKGNSVLGTFALGRLVQLTGWH